MTNIPPSDRLTTNVKYEEVKLSFDFCFLNTYSLLKLFFLQTFIHRVILQPTTENFLDKNVRIGADAEEHTFFNLDQK